MVGGSLFVLASVLVALVWIFISGFKSGYTSARCRDTLDAEACRAACEAGKTELCELLGDALANQGDTPGAARAYSSACRGGASTACAKLQPTSL